MNFNIIWSPKAQKTYYDTVIYLLENWTEKEARKFVDRTQVVINHIAKNYLLYPYSKEGDIYKAVINWQISLFYRVKGINIELLVFWDNRQRPSKLKKIIK